MSLSRPFALPDDQFWVQAAGPSSANSGHYGQGAKMLKVKRISQRILALVCICLTAPTVVAGGDSYLATSRAVDWAFMQSVGGIKVGEQIGSGKGNRFLPLVCDVSGLTIVTRKPTAMNSGLVVAKILYQVNGRELRVSAAVNNPAGSARNSQCAGVTIEGAEKGTYKVLYIDPDNSVHSVGEVTFE
jgi:hypothetical protein